MSEDLPHDTTTPDVDSEINALEESNVQENRSPSSLLPESEAQAESESEQKESKAERPDYWPEDLWDKERGTPKLEDANERIKKAEEIAMGLRKKLSTKDVEDKKEPESSVPESYDFEALKSEEFEGMADELAVNTFGRAAKEAGLTNEQANTVVNEYLKVTQEQIEEVKTKEVAKLGDDAEYILSTINNYLTARVNNKTFSQEESQALANAITTAQGARALSKLIMQTGDKSIPTKVRFTGENRALKDVQDEMTVAVRARDEKRVEQLREELKMMTK